MPRRRGRGYRKNRGLSSRPNKKSTMMKRGPAPATAVLTIENEEPLHVFCCSSCGRFYEASTSSVALTCSDCEIVLSRRCQWCNTNVTFRSEKWLDHEENDYYARHKKLHPDWTAILDPASLQEKEIQMEIEFSEVGKRTCCVVENEEEEEDDEQEEEEYQVVEEKKEEKEDMSQQQKKKRKGERAEELELGSPSKRPRKWTIGGEQCKSEDSLMMTMIIPPKPIKHITPVMMTGPVEQNPIFSFLPEPPKTQPKLSIAKHQLNFTTKAELDNPMNILSCGTRNADLSNMDISQLVFDPTKHIELQSLNLSNCEISDLPPSLNQMTNLTSLNLCGNTLGPSTEKLFIGLSNLGKLKRLGLDHNGIEHLSPQITTLKSLEYLSVFGNMIQETQFIVELAKTVEIDDGLGNMCYNEEEDLLSRKK